MCYISTFWAAAEAKPPQCKLSNRLSIICVTGSEVAVADDPERNEEEGGGDEPGGGLLGVIEEGDANAGWPTGGGDPKQDYRNWYGPIGKAFPGFVRFFAGEK
jgi:hypothetical protein